MAQSKSKPHLSSLEAKFVALAKAQDLPFEFEADSFAYTIVSRYTPDFKIRKNVYIETKGHFDSSDRRKMVAFKQQYPHIRIHLLFGNANNKIRAGSKTTYAAWAVKNGFSWSDIREGLPRHLWKVKNG